MGDIRNCPRCGKIFTYMSKPICNACLDLEEEEFKLVKEYIYDNPGASMTEVSNETGVSVDKIMRFLRDERLEISSENSNLMLECEGCGRPLRSGKFCDDCRKNLANSFKREFGLDKPKTVVDETKPKTEREKMFTATRRK